ncbi:Multiple inositol polyphosphate phosphatase [Pelomyxa schiedti]|nr:Multiple inositol polyphosphate phosphatase [Pelomyxa schiedti]
MACCRLIFATLLGLLVAVVVVGDSDFDVRQHTCTKTPYRNDRLWTVSSPDVDPENCEVVHINTVTRHGSRFPTQSSCEEYDQLAAYLAKQKSLKQGYEWLSSWQNPYTIAVSGLLCDMGENELYDLGTRLAQDYPTFLTPDLTLNQVPVQCTQTTRTGQSATSFLLALSENLGGLTSCKLPAFSMFSDTKSMDKTLRFFDACPAYEAAMDAGLGTEQSDLYAERNIPAVIADVSDRTGLTMLTGDYISNMWELCTYDIVMENSTDQWCSLFSESDILVFETIEDLEHYYEHGYGLEINTQMGCALLQEVVEIMDAVWNYDTDSDYYDDSAKFRFAHAETIMPLVSLLGLFKDNVTLTADTPADVLAARQWRTSILAIFSANFQFVLYNCTGVAYVHTRFNEQDIVLPGCHDSFCLYTTFKDSYASILNLDFTTLCTVPSSSAMQSNNVAVPRPSVATLLFFLSLCILALIL